MDQFKDVSLPLTLVFEGSEFTNNPADKGGPTKYGIIQKEYDKYRMKKGLSIQSVKYIAMPEVEDIYYTGYWVPSKCGQMPPKVSVAVFDTSVNSGQGRSIRFLQQAIGAEVDGIIGSETIAKMKDMDDSKVANTCLDNKEAFYKKIVDGDLSQAQFLGGWLRRVKYLRDYINGVKTLEQIKATW